MKKWTKKVWMSAAAVSRVQYFTIQNNTACASSIRLTGLYFNVNNISNSSVQATLYLYKNNGILFTIPGITTSTGLRSTLTPGLALLLTLIQQNNMLPLLVAKQMEQL